MMNASPALALLDPLLFERLPEPLVRREPPPALLDVLRVLAPPLAVFVAFLAMSLSSRNVFR